MRTIRVRVDEQRHYPVVVGHGAVASLPDVLPVRAKRVGVVTQASLPIEVHLSGIDQHQIIVPEGEGAKALATVESICRQLASAGFTRDDVIVGLGGGVVTDLAGFAAAVYHRGIAVVHVATTLLAQVDAAIGGKTGVNLPEGKNLVGAFWQPAAVICDIDHLDTLPPRELRSGLGEVAKYHFLGGDFEGKELADQVADCVAIKAAVVEEDERESGRRAILNYGHTLGHAVEIAEKFDVRHGEAVAIGLVFAARLARRLGRIDGDRVDQHRKVVGSYDLPSSLPGDADLAELLDLMQRDKKARDGLTFVLDGPRGVEAVKVDAALVMDELTKMREEER